MAARRGPVTREAILAAFPATGRWFVQPKYIADKVCCSVDTARKRLAKMAAAGEIERASGPAFGRAAAPFTYRRKAAD